MSQARKKLNGQRLRGVAIHGVNSQFLSHETTNHSVDLLCHHDGAFVDTCPKPYVRPAASVVYPALFDSHLTTACKQTKSSGGTCVCVCCGLG
jgi:hypothetical protein